MRKLISVATVLAVGAFVAVNLTKAEEKKDEKEKKPMSIHDVMEKGFKGGKKGLLGIVTDKKKESSKEENEKFLGMLKDMAKQKPPKGDEKSWKKFTTALVEPAELIVKGEEVEKSKLALKKAASCGKCHKVHRPKKDE